LTSFASCCLFGGEKAVLGDYTDIAMLFSDFFDFHGTLDITRSDVIVGLLLVRQVQKQRETEIRKKIHASTSRLSMAESSSDSEASEMSETEREQERNIASVRQSMRNAPTYSHITYRLKRYGGAGYQWESAVSTLLQMNNHYDRLVLAEGARYSRLSLAIYTWIMYSLHHCGGFCSIVCKATARNFKKGKKRHYAGDAHCCRLHSTAFMKEAGIQDEADIIYASFHSDIVASPYAVVLDHEWKSVVIVIRGTLSLEDALTDLDLEPTCLEAVGNECGFDGTSKHAHAGILQTCQWILKDLRKRETLDQLLDIHRRYSDYRLRVTGHSLGAGCAAVLAMMLRPKYPNLRCHAFSPPGCTLSENAAVECEDYMTSYVLDADIVPRASLNALENLRLNMVEMIARIRVSKAEVLNEYAYGCMAGDEDSRLDRMMFKEEDVPDNEFQQQYCEYRRQYDERKKGRGKSIEIEMFVPGKIVHLVHSGITDAKKEYTSRWANRLDFREIRISTHFLDDHNPHSVMRSIETEAQKFGLELPYNGGLPREAVVHPEELATSATATGIEQQIVQPGSAVAVATTSIFRGEMTV